MNPVNPITYNDVYYVEAAREMSMNPVAIRPEIHKNYARWNDTSRGGVVSIDSIETEPKDSTSPPKKIIIKTKEGEKVILWQLSLEIYNAKVKKWVYNQPEFTSHEQLQEFYLKTNFI
jgi:hypothetical protein